MMPRARTAGAFAVTDMYLVALAWLYVALMMALAEGVSSQGSVLGALVTFVIYGALPLSIVLYIGLWPARRRLRQAREAHPSPGDGDGRSHAARGAVAPEREEH